MVVTATRAAAGHALGRGRHHGRAPLAASARLPLVADGAARAGQGAAPDSDRGRARDRRRLSSGIPRGAVARRRDGSTPVGLADRAGRPRAARARGRVPEVLRRGERNPAVLARCAPANVAGEGRGPRARASRDRRQADPRRARELGLSARVRGRLLRRGGPRRDVAADLARRPRRAGARPRLRGVARLRAPARAPRARCELAAPARLDRGAHALLRDRPAGDPPQARERLRPGARLYARAGRGDRARGDARRRRHPDLDRDLLRGRARDSQLLRAPDPRVPGLLERARLRDADPREARASGAPARAALAAELEAAGGRDLGGHRRVSADRAEAASHAALSRGAGRLPQSLLDHHQEPSGRARRGRAAGAGAPPGGVGHALAHDARPRSRAAHGAASRAAACAARGGRSAGARRACRWA